VSRAFTAIKLWFYAFKNQWLYTGTWCAHFIFELAVKRLLNDVLRPRRCLILFTHLECPLQPSSLTGLFKVLSTVAADWVRDLAILILSRSKTMSVINLQLSQHLLHTFRWRPESLFFCYRIRWGVSLSQS
jgi:hypothetical protein